MTSEFPAQKASNAENASIWWRHHDFLGSTKIICIVYHSPHWDSTPDSKVHGATMGPTWVLSAPDGPHVGPMKNVIRDRLFMEDKDSFVLYSQRYGSWYPCDARGQCISCHDIDPVLMLLIEEENNHVICRCLCSSFCTLTKLWLFFFFSIFNSEITFLLCINIVPLT